MAVGELRRRKRRGGKPFAVMVRDLATARELAVVDDGAAQLLTGIDRPVVVMPRRTPALGTIPVAVCDAVAPGNPDLGVLLPYTPLHLLVMGLEGDEPGPPALVMTSGNLGGEPIVTDDTDALQRLAQLADGQGLAAAVDVGDLVALHWDWLCDVVSPEQRDAIERRNVEQVHAVNAQVLNA